jgi:hypothetical protein
MAIYVRNLILFIVSLIELGLKISIAVLRLVSSLQDLIWIYLVSEFLRQTESFKLKNV